MHLYIYIDHEYKEVELDADAAVELNYSFASLESPADYISEYSYEVEVPKSQANNRLFGEAKKTDSKKQVFLPNQRYDYIYEAGGNVISNGQLTLEKIGRDTYTINLNGALYTAFSRLLDSGWDTNADDPDYALLDEYFSGVTVSPSFASKSFETDTSELLDDWEDVKAIADDEERAAQIIGMMPTNNAESGSFSADRWLVGDYILPVGDTSTTTSNDLNTGEMAAETMAEYRVQKLRPYVYVRRLWDIYKEQCEAVTGYTLNLDSRWFNSAYEYLQGMAYTLPALDDENVETSTQTAATVLTTFSADYDIFKSLNKTVIDSHTITVHGRNKATFDWDIPLTIASAIDGDENAIFSQFYMVNVVLKVTDGTTTYYTKAYHYLPQPGYLMNDGQTWQHTTSKSLFPYNDTVEYRYEAEKAYDAGTGRWMYTFGHLVGSVTLYDLDNAHAEYTVTIYARPNTSPDYNDNPVKRLYHHGRGLLERAEIVDYSPLAVGMLADSLYYMTMTIVNGYGSTLSLERVFKDIKPFSILLKYSKMLGLLWVVDDISRTISVVRRSDYFYDAFYGDLANKSPNVGFTGWMPIDGKCDADTMTIIPVSWAYRTAVFNYSPSSDKYSKAYAEKYGRAFGSLAVVTNNEKCIGSQDLFEGEYAEIANPMFSAEFNRPLNWWTGGVDKKVLGDDFFTGDEGAFVFRRLNGTYNSGIRQGWRTDGGGAWVLLSADTSKEDEAKTYCYHYAQRADDIKTYIRPVFSEMSDQGAVALFGQPREYYTANFPAAKSNEDYIYTREWADYIQEVYNTDNQTVTMDAWLSSDEYNRMKINPFVTVGGIGYLATDISGWRDGHPCTLTLRQVTDVQRLIAKSKSKDRKE